MLTRTAGVLLKNTVGGSALIPSAFFGMIWLASTCASTRSRPSTRCSSGTDSATSFSTSWICSFFKVEKFDSVTLKSEKLTSLVSTDTWVSDSIFSVPKAGAAAPLGVYETAVYSTTCRWFAQVATWG